MRAIRVCEFGPPEAMKLENLPELRPQPGQVLVKIGAAGVNPVDTYIRAGLYRPDLPLPYTPGIDGAGTVEAVGAGVETVEPGQRVYLTWAASGSYAERALCAEAHVFPLPDAVSFSQGAALGVPYATAFRALFQKAHAVAGETVLIHGASGGVGLAAIQWARAAGLRIIGTAGSETGRQLVKRHGAHHAVDHKDPRHTDSILPLTGGQGVNIILEMLANVNLGADLPLLARGGRVVVIGSRGTVEIDPRDVMGRDAAILGMLLFNISASDLASAHAAILAGLENGTLCPLVSKELPLADAANAHHTLMETSPLGKIVLVP
ncbi:MAG: NADPH:quinone reductase [Lentisphaerae bacterium]|nr:NADPH:quinone reductase [Lentisphaerota bacterium]